MSGGAGVFDKRVQRLSAAPFRSEISSLGSGAMRVSIETLHGPIRVHGRLPDGLIHVGLTHGEGFALGGRRVDRPTLLVQGAGARFDSTISGSMTSVSLVVTRQGLEAPDDRDDPLHAWLDVARGRSIEAGPAGARLARLLHDLSDRIAREDELRADPSGGLLRDELLGALRLTVGAGDGRVDDVAALGPASRRRLALRAEELILAADDGMPPSVESLCRTLGTSERSLQLAFGEQFGTNVRTFVRNVRLQKAHAMIARLGDRLTLTDIATHHGFWHLGRFAQYYRQLFGCPPSETQQRLRGRAAAAPVA